MPEPAHHTLAPGRDIDLDTEDIRLPDATRLTSERATQIAG